MDRMGYDEVARISAYIDLVICLARNCVPRWRAALNVEEPTDLATPERETIIDEILDDVVGLGPLQPLIEDDTVTEIMINGCRSASLNAAASCTPSSMRSRMMSDPCACRPHHLATWPPYRRAQPHRQRPPQNGLSRQRGDSACGD